MYIRRKIEDTILKYIHSPEIIAIVGPRQAGKTTLLKHIYNSLGGKAVFLTFEDNKLLNLFVKNIDLFIKEYIKPYNYIFIDEFHYAKKGGKLLKFIIDTNPKKIFISGSSSIDLSVQSVKYLVGRIFVFNLFQFDFEEFLTAKKPKLINKYKQFKLNLDDFNIRDAIGQDPQFIEQLKSSYEEYAVFGGYPRVVLSNDIEEKKTVLKNIYNTYFLREVKDILGLVDDYKMAQMIKALALQIGSLIEYGEISKTSEMSFQTVKGYVNFLQKTYITHFIKPYFKNKRTEIVKNPKPYFFDTGFRNYVIDDFRPIDERQDGGQLLENTVAMQMIKCDKTFRFWRNKRKSEVDFIVDLPNSKKAAFEIKKSFDIQDLSSKSATDFTSRYKEIPLIFCTYHGSTDSDNKSVSCIFM